METTLDGFEDDVAAAEAAAATITANLASALAAKVAAELAETNAETAEANAEAAAVLTAADRVQTGLDRVATAADVVLAEADRVATAADRVQTGLDAVATAADRVQTGLDADATAADAVATAADAVATAADRVQTGLDRAQTGADVVSAAAVLASAALKANNLSDLASPPAARTNLGVPVYGTLALAQAATVLAEVKSLRLHCRTTAGYGGGDYTRMSLATITSAGYPAAAYFRTTDRIMPDGSTDATNGGYWLNLSDTLDFFQFGAIGDATVTNDSAAIIAAILHAKLTGRMLRPVGTFRVQEKIVINCDGFDGTLCTLNVYSTPAIACEISTGDAANPITIFSQSVGRHIVTPVLINMTKPGTGWASQGIGLRLVNCQNVEVKLNVITNFAIGVQLTSYTQSCLHNKLFVSMLLNNKVNVQVLVGDAGGSTNSNIFFGGHFVHYSDEGTAVSGVRHVEIVPHATFSQVNHTSFHGCSLEGTAEDYHVYDGGQSNNYIDCRWETNNGPRFRQGQSSPAQTGQGGNHTIVYGYGVDENSYLTVTNDTDATTRITILGPGLGRRSSSGPIDLQTSVGSGEPVYRGFASADNLNTIDRDDRWSWHLSNTGLSGKQTADVYARATYDFVNGGLLFGNGTAAPAAGIRAFGSSSAEIVGHTYWDQQALNAGNVSGYGTLSYMDDDKWKTVLSGGTMKTFVISSESGWTAGTGTANKGSFATYAGQNVSAAYVEAEAQATDDAVKANSQRIKAIEDALRACFLIN